MKRFINAQKMGNRDQCHKNSVLLFLFILISQINSSYGRIEYITSTNIYRDCNDICGYKGYDCISEHLQNFDCKFVAEEICGVDDMMSDNNYYLKCVYGGCFMNCATQTYADKLSSSSTCSTHSDCFNSQNQPPFSKICACDSGEAIVLTVWQIIGIATGVFFFFSMVCALLMYCYMDYTLKR